MHEKINEIVDDILEKLDTYARDVDFELGLPMGDECQADMHDIVKRGFNQITLEMRVEAAEKGKL